MLCRNCNTEFSALSAFDKHQYIDNDGKVQCKPPADCGLVQQRTGKWGQPGPDRHWKETAMQGQDTLIRECTNCDGPFVRWGRGRPPARCSDCGGSGEPVEQPDHAIGMWLGEDGVVRSERGECPAPAATPPPTARVHAEIPVVPAPPPARVDGKTAVEDGLVLPDPPSRLDRFESLYPDEDFLRWDEEIVEPEFDEYMEALVAAGELRPRGVKC